MLILLENLNGRYHPKYEKYSGTKKTFLTVWYTRNCEVCQNFIWENFAYLLTGWCLTLIILEETFLQFVLLFHLVSSSFFHQLFFFHCLVWPWFYHDQMIALCRPENLQFLLFLYWNKKNQCILFTSLEKGNVGQNRWVRFEIRLVTVFWLWHAFHD